MRAHSAHSRRLSKAGVLAAIASSLFVGACSSGGALESLDGMLSSQQTASVSASSDDKKAPPKSELDKAIAHWGEQHKKNPHDLKIALSYARNLKAAGHKEQAFGVLQGVAILHGDSKELASEYGRLALDFDQIAVAEKLLAMADDPTKPDWKLVSARGTLLAKQGKYADAILFFEEALKMQPNQTSLLNNLAMAYAADGQPAKAEEILRKAIASSDDPKLKQNLALVLGLQNKHDEAKVVSSAAVSPEATNANVEYVRAMVKPNAQPAAAPAVISPPARAAAKGSAGPRVIEAKAPPANTMRPSGGPADGSAPSGAWSTTVSR